MTDSDEPESREADSAEADEGSIASITPDVMGVLNDRGFFSALDDLFCPEEQGREAAKCQRNFEISKEILRKLEIPKMHIDDAIEVLHEQGACCDCEILYNVAEESRLKARYWKARYQERHGEPETK